MKHQTIAILKEGGSQLSTDESYGIEEKENVYGLTGSVLKFVKDETYFLYSEAEQKVCEVIGTYKALAEDRKLKNLLLQLEDLISTITRLFYLGLEETEVTMKVFLEKFEELQAYEVIPA
ncbi:MAG: hypothetical protein PHZ26_03660 [Candidatus Gracilibacteria bacterium]|nr:hypothetical protein [Candidatus Gracilibacteria bacterium]MDD2908824.1 hypothetical protein [Candidatus Gracilibacteria bacterium]